MSKEMERFNFFFNFHWKAQKSFYEMEVSQGRMLKKGKKREMNDTKNEMQEQKCQ